MAIIKHTTAAGITYCYESTPKWDPVKKQARPQKTYLGRWDDETQTIIPSSGKRGRRKSEDVTVNPNPPQINQDEDLLQEYQKKLEETQNELRDAKNTIRVLNKKINEYAAFVESIRNGLKKIT